MASHHIILASRSPRRIALLSQLGVDCTVMPADIDESVVPGEDPASYVQRLAIAKAQAVAHMCAIAHKPSDDERPILAADTTVALGKRILGKPTDAQDAYAMLRDLSGTTHWVHTAVALHWQGQCRCVLSSTVVEMVAVPDTVLLDYIASGEPMDKAGAYGIQGRAGRWIKRIDGSYSGVMGLPLHETAQLLGLQ